MLKSKFGVRLNRFFKACCSCTGTTHAKNEGTSASAPAATTTSAALNKQADALAESLSNAKHVIVLCGAGLSVSAGIPDFRTPGTGLYSQLEKYHLPYPEAVFDLSFFQENPAPFTKLACEMWPGNKYRPTLGHYFIRLLQEKGKLLRCFTQNIDSLESLAGLPGDKLVAAHGNFDTASCVLTGIQVPIEEVRQAYLGGDLSKLNVKHGTKLVKPDIVFFGESLPERFFECSKTDFSKCDLLIVMGTSLKVEPFASLIEKTPRGIPRVLINREKAGERDGHWRGGNGFFFDDPSGKDTFMQGDCDQGCLALARALGWEERLLQLKREGDVRPT